MFRSIKTKILVLQLGLVLSVVCAIGVSTYLIMLDAMENSQRQNLELMVRNTGENLNKNIEDRKAVLAKIATSEETIAFIRKQQDMLLLKQFSQHSSAFPVLFYANVDGIEQFKYAQGKMTTEYIPIRETSVFADAAAHHNEVFCEYMPAEPDFDKPHLVFGFYGMNFFDEFTGFIGGEVAVSDIAGNIENLRVGETGYVMLIDSQGNILVCGDKDKISGKIAIEGAADTAMQEILAMESGYGRGKVMGVDSYFTFAPIVGIDWSVVTVMPHEEFVARLDTLRSMVALIGLVVLIVCGLVMKVAADNLIRPILTLTEKTASIAHGDFSQRVETISHDELGILAQSFNRMAEDLANTTTSMANLNLEVAERKKAEDGIVKANMELEAAVVRLTHVNRELEEFAYIVAHDLKTPLRAIGSLAGMIAVDYSDSLDQKGKQYLAIMLGRVERMNRFIKGILRYSELGRPLEQELVDLNEVVDEVFAEVVLPTNCIMAIENTLPQLMCNRSQVVEIFGHLISNAARYMDKPTGRISIGCRKGDGFWKFSVEDNGCGIDEKYLDKIFRIFQTLNRRDETETTGIGLSLVRKIVEIYDGKVWVESRPGEGSKFYFTLPIQVTGVEHEKLSTNTAR